MYSDPMRRRLHVKVSRSCNNNCLFCLDDRDLRTDVTDEEVARLLAESVSLGEVLFTCGEPTIHPGLPRYIAMARRAGYRSVGLVTNGRRLAYRDYCDSLVEAGLTEITISIHGHESRLHDALTRTRGAFEQTMDGLRNAMRHRPSVRLISSTVVVRQNAEHLAEFLAMVDGVDVSVINVVEPTGMALQHFGSVFTSYSDLAAQVATTLRGFDGDREVIVEGLPLCLCRDFPDRTGVREEIHLLEGQLFHALPTDRGHTLTEVCDDCLLRARCPGIYTEYANRVGTDELVPVLRPERG